MHRKLFIRSLLLYVSLTVLTSLSAAQDIPFTLEKGMIVVKATAIKNAPIEVVIATGSPDSIINMDFVLRSKILPGYTSGRYGEAVPFVDVPNISIGDHKPVSLKMKGSGMASVVKTLGRQIEAVLGADYFKGDILQIDFKARVIRFLKTPPVDYKSIATQTSTSWVFQMDQLSETFLGQEVTLPIIVGATFDSEKLRSLIDTAVAYPVTLSPAAIKELSLGDPPVKGTSRSDTLKSFSFADINAADIPAKFVGKDAGFDTPLKDHGAIIGVGVLQNFTVTFDWKDKKIVLERTP